MATSATEIVGENDLNESNVSNAADSSHDSQDETENTPQEEQRDKLVKLPLGRVKHIVKMDPDVNLVTQDAIFLIAKSTELFIDSMAKEAYKYTVQTKKKTIQKRDVENAIDNVDALVFLEGTLEWHLKLNNSAIIVAQINHHSYNFHTVFITFIMRKRWAELYSYKMLRWYLWIEW